MITRSYPTLVKTIAPVLIGLLLSGHAQAGDVAGELISALIVNVPADPFPIRQFSVSHHRIARMDERINYRLACAAARLRLYPLAMRLFLHSLRAQRSAGFSKSGTAEQAGPPFSAEEEAGFLSMQAEALRPHLVEASPRHSPVTRLDSMIGTLADTVAGARYAIIIQVKQPIFGRRRIFKGLGNVGHSFITLIRYNPDQSVAVFSFGLYPKKSYPLAASPIFPRTPALFRDDRAHDWDELAGRFVSARQFMAICRTAVARSRKHYDLNKNNCTDFALEMGNLAGIRFSGTTGTWPLGSGNNPACLGQSILKGDFGADDLVSKDGLFVETRGENNF